ncbi:MAG: riboflavin synthase [bacterium]
MFTGIVQETGTIEEKKEVDGEGYRFSCKELQDNHGPFHAGDSIAVDGVCLTAEEIEDCSFTAHLSRETMDKTTFDKRTTGDAVNLEPSLKAGDPLGGHMVFGHVDTTVPIVNWELRGEDRDLTFQFPEEFRPFLARKGSVALDGISLTLNEVGEDRATIRIVPHTMSNTVLDRREKGDHLNLEVDMLARYAYNYFSTQTDQTDSGMPVTESLIDQGQPNFEGE